MEAKKNAPCGERFSLGKRDYARFLREDFFFEDFFAALRFFAAILFSFR